MSKPKSRNMLFVVFVIVTLCASVTLAQIIDLEANKGYYSTKITVAQGAQQQIAILIRGHDIINVTVAPTRDPVELVVKDPEDRIIRREFIPVKTVVTVNVETKGMWRIIIYYPITTATALSQDVYLEVLGIYAPRPVAPTTTPPSREAAIPWMLIGIVGGGIVAVAVVAVAFLTLRRKPVTPPRAPSPPAPSAQAQAPLARAEETVVIERAPTYRETEMILATLEFPDGRMLPITSPRQVFGRADFERYVSADMLKYVSRRHFMISLEPGGFFIEDLGSANGTVVNGSDIRGKGRVPLKTGDTIEVGGVIKLRFKSGS